MARNYFVNEGNHIGGQEAQALGSAQARLKASAAVTKGQVVESTGDWTCGPAGDNSGKVIGVAMVDAKVGELVTVETEGLFKLTASAAAITAGDKIVSAAGGLVRKFVTGTDKAENTLGNAYAGCSASGEVYVKFSI